MLFDTSSEATRKITYSKLEHSAYLCRCTVVFSTALSNELQFPWYGCHLFIGPCQIFLIEIEIMYSYWVTGSCIHNSEESAKKGQENRWLYHGYYDFWAISEREALSVSFIESPLFKICSTFLHVLAHLPRNGAGPPVQRKTRKKLVIVANNICFRQISHRLAVPEKSNMRHFGQFEYDHPKTASEKSAVMIVAYLTASSLHIGRELG